MIKINCVAQGTIRLSECTPFQGNLKKRTEAEVAELMRSIKTEGLIMPFAVWQNDGRNYLLDGHGRLEALRKLALTEPDIDLEEFPCIFIKADSENDARKALLQITSSYGRITKMGVKQFTVSIPDYRAPSINRYVVNVKKTDVKPVMDRQINAPSDSIIKLRVKEGMKDDAGIPITKERVLEILGRFNFLEIL